MFLAVDIGGTKILLAVFSAGGELMESLRFPTPKTYQTFLDDFKAGLQQIHIDDVRSCVVAIPGRVDRKRGIGLAFGNLPWKNVPIERDVEWLLNAPVKVENDANLGGLSEARLIKDEYKKVLYVTISTGIGTGIIIDGVIDPAFADSEGGRVRVDYNGHSYKWEDIASGKAIVKVFGKEAHDITDPKDWQDIARRLAVGLIDLTAVLQPEVIIIGGGVGVHYNHFGRFLGDELKKFETPVTPVPVIRKAARPEEAVIYGCYQLARDSSDAFHRKIKTVAKK